MIWLRKEEQTGERYLFEASVLDVELLGINEVKQFAVLFPGGRETDRLKMGQIMRFR